MNPINPGQIAAHYSRFRVSERLLLSGHSHQAWPDVSFEAQQQAWLDAAAQLDHKWALAESQAEAVREGWRRLLGAPGAEVALGGNTHELVTRFLSGLPLGARPTIVTTDGEFHTIRRQLDRLGEAGVEVRKVPSRPTATLADRLAAVVTGRTAAVLVSSVLFETAEIVPHLSVVANACAHHGAELLVDVYHQLNVVPFSLEAAGLTNAYIVGGGYKYCQLGEGNCFLRVPDHCRMRPLFTGWFAEFAAIEQGQRAGEVVYGSGASRFAGSTYDPVSHYRAAEVFAFHEREGLTPEPLRQLSLQQTRLIAWAVADADLDPAIAEVEPLTPQERAGFVAIRMPDAAGVARTLNARGVWCDARGQWLRFGPAPYVTNEQLFGAVGQLVAIVRDEGPDPVRRN
jgi:kynureninase